MKDTKELEKRIAALEATVAEHRKESIEFAYKVGADQAEVEDRFDELDEIIEQFDEEFDGCAEDIMALGDVLDNQSLVNNAHHDRLGEMERFLNVERTPYWKWNDEASQYETGYILRPILRSFISIPSVWMAPNSTGNPPAFTTTTTGGHLAGYTSPVAT